LALLRRGTDPSKPENTGIPPRIIRREEGARRMACSLRTFDKLCKEGVLKKHVLPGRTRAAGILESDLIELLTKDN
jgi:hypothetical protein